MTEESKESRIRIALKETAKGLIQREITIETFNGDQFMVHDGDDMLKVEGIPIHQKIWDEFDMVKKEGLERGNKFVGDE